MTLLRGYGENLPLLPWLEEKIFPFESKLTGEAVYWATMLAMGESLRFGITSTTDMYYFSENMVEAVKDSKCKNNISRAVTNFTGEDPEQLKSFEEMKDLYRKHHREGSDKIRVDFSIHAEYTSNPETVKKIAEYNEKIGTRIHIHLSETEREHTECIKKYGKTPAAYFDSLGLFNAPATAANLNMAFYFFVLLAIPSIAFFRRHYAHPYERAANEGIREGENRAASYWGRKEISLLDIAKVVASGFILVAVSVKLADWMGAHPSLPTALRGILGSKYFVVTTLTVLIVTLFPKFFEEARGSQEIGTFLIYIFLVVIGTPASIKAILFQSPIILLFCSFAVVVNMAVTLLVGKLFGFNLEELLISSNATIGGPTTAAAMAISKGWDDLVLPAMLVGVWGYVIGNWIAITLGQAVFPRILGL